MVYSNYLPYPSKMEVMEANIAQAKAYLFLLGFFCGSKSWRFFWAFASTIFPSLILTQYHKTHTTYYL